LADLRLEDGPAQISRDAIRRRTIIECNVRGRDLAGFVTEAQQVVEREVKLPPGYMLNWGGQFRNLQEASKRLMIAVPLALFLISAMLRISFNSMRLAALIFLNVPLAATGGIVALWLRVTVLDLGRGGVHRVVRRGGADGVVLVTSVELRKKGMDPLKAAFKSAHPLAAVLMTALVFFMLGFIPMAISTIPGRGSTAIGDSGNRWTGDIDDIDVVCVADAAAAGLTRP
jgi:cobalt-zinc-cadmium resistance protein CzcA